MQYSYFFDSLLHKLIEILDMDELLGLLHVGPKAYRSTFYDVNSCSYSTNDLVLISIRYLIKILVGI